MTSTSTDDIDRAVDALASAKDRWVRVPIPERLALLARARDLTLACAEDQVRAACAAKGLDFDSPASTEEWLSGPLTIVRHIRLFIETLAALDQTGRLPIGASAVRTRPNGQLAVRVFPGNHIEPLLYPGTTAEVWLDPKVQLDEAGGLTALERGPGKPAPTIGGSGGVRLPWREPCRGQADQLGKVALVLAAGNVASIGPADVLYKLFVENRVCLLKMHPVNDYLGTFVERAFAPFIEAGCLRLVYGGAAEGAYLAHHPDVDEIHITGAAATHDAIVWGDTPAERARAKASGTPVIHKRITSELGCVTPVIIAPGRWSDREIGYQAENVATMIAINASCNCNAAKTLVTWRGWPQRQAFLRRLEDVLAALPPRKAYYPGSVAKFAAFMAAHPGAKRLAEPAAESIPWTTIFDVDPSAKDDIVFREEAWCPIIAETALAASDEGQFMEEAVRFSNERLWGTLSCTVIADGRLRKRLGDRFARAIDALRYGTVSINHWAALGFVFGSTPWGAAPGHTLEDIGSGIGMVHNTSLLDRPVKSVIDGPFTQWPKPIWFVTHRSGHRAARRMLAFEARPSWSMLPALAFHAMRA